GRRLRCLEIAGRCRIIRGRQSSQVGLRRKAQLGDRVGGGRAGSERHARQRGQCRVAQSPATGRALSPQIVSPCQRVWRIACPCHWRKSKTALRQPCTAGLSGPNRSSNLRGNAAAVTLSTQSRLSRIVSSRILRVIAVQTRTFTYSPGASPKTAV